MIEVPTPGLDFMSMKREKTSRYLPQFFQFGGPIWFFQYEKISNTMAKPAGAG
jgi:hypothetical protein